MASPLRNLMSSIERDRERMASPLRRNPEYSSANSMALAGYLGERLNHVLSGVSDHERETFFTSWPYGPQINNPSDHNAIQKAQEIAAAEEEEEVKQEEKDASVERQTLPVIEQPQKSTDHLKVAAEAAGKVQAEKEGGGGGEEKLGRN